MKRILSTVFLLILIHVSPANAWSKLTKSLDIQCKQSQETLNCEYRSLIGEKITSINATTADKKLLISNNKPYPDNESETAILFLVDTSDPGRQNVVNKNKSQIKKILSSLKPHQKAGLASFDKSLNIESPIGTSNFLISKSVNNLKASGKTTELYRNLLQAIRHIDAFEAQRKVIVLFSDGQAEDKAYFHSDIIKQARKSGVIINSIGYPRSIALSVALQTIRRLSEETGGYYFETDMSYNLPEEEINKLFKNVDNGGSFSVLLSSLVETNTDINSVSLSLVTNSGVKNIKAPVVIKSKKQLVESDVSNTPIIINDIETKPITNPSNKAPIQIITKQAKPQPVNLWLWYGLPAAFIIIIIFILITLFLLWKRPEQKTSGSENEYRPYAYLISNDELQTRYPITRTICRIGRSKDNELHLDDTSISRRHAEIHRNNDGSFEIMDMNSTNGVYINNEKIGKAQLHEGDVIEIGDFFLHFTQLAADYSLEESTVMQKTRAPVTH